MLEIHQIRHNKATVIQGLQKKKVKDAAVAVEQLLAIDQQRRDTQVALDKALATMKQQTKQLAQWMQTRKKEAVDAMKSQTSALKVTIKELTHQLKSHEDALQQALYALPNLPHAEVPEGDHAADNEVVYQVPDLPPVAKQQRPHWELGRTYDIIDFALGNKITKAGFPVYKGKGAILQRALIHFFLDEASKVGYEEIQPPLLVNQASAYGTGQLPDKERQMYQLLGEDLYLVPTAEVPITNLYRQQIVPKAALPIKNVGYTPCFRREAGAWGSQVRGLNRLHQFDKVELVQLTLPEQSYQALQEMCTYVTQLVTKLALPYRVLRLCGGDLGFTAALTYDIEVFAAAQGRWLEVSSVSNFATYQANRMKIRYRTAHHKPQLLHTLNGSALALPRVMAALLENNQTPLGITIPTNLRPYTGFDMIQ